MKIFWDKMMEIPWFHIFSLLPILLCLYRNSAFPVPNHDLKGCYRCGPQGVVGPVKLHWPKYPFSSLWRLQLSLTWLLKVQIPSTVLLDIFVALSHFFSTFSSFPCPTQWFPTTAWSAQLRAGSAWHLLLPGNCIQKLFGEKFVGLLQEPVPIKGWKSPPPGFSIGIN